jgi:hypothetical protein
MAAKTDETRYTNVRVRREDVIGIWRPNKRRDEGDHRRLSDDEVKNLIEAKEKTMGRRPPIRSWRGWTEMSQGGVTKPRFERLWGDLFRDSPKGRPTKQNAPK